MSFFPQIWQHWFHSLESLVEYSKSKQRAFDYGRSCARTIRNRIRIRPRNVSDEPQRRKCDWIILFGRPIDKIRGFRCLFPPIVLKGSVWKSLSFFLLNKWSFFADFGLGLVASLNRFLDFVIESSRFLAKIAKRIESSGIYSRNRPQDSHLQRLIRKRVSNCTFQANMIYVNARPSKGPYAQGADASFLPRSWAGTPLWRPSSPASWACCAWWASSWSRPLSKVERPRGYIK
jgi:hypothetical protein